MIEPIEFSIFLKIVGGTSIVSLATQIFSIFNISIEIEKKRKLLFKEQPKNQLGETVEYSSNEQPVLEQSSELKKHLTKLLWGFIIAVLSILVYAVTSHIPYLCDCKGYVVFVSTISYLALFLIPVFVTYHLYKIFEIYYKISLVEINNTNTNE